ncbi:hypothetical protein P171DRAFT_31086 [Karstenula rhodostoma CBS 690.94]|uniref:Uncharacterized protein n=1 Tax=Karstenula rhodostoma CBS 690.94 TaxID=1392251 RepID=A0A9P4UCG7_9PLEO|nr:hypothetical protein P171DRAFT_31086 [Karstenula rhodostoma CBS 690.94]
MAMASTKQACNSPNRPGRKTRVQLQLQSLHLASRISHLASRISHLASCALRDETSQPYANGKSLPGSLPAACLLLPTKSPSSVAPFWRMLAPYSRNLARALTGPPNVSHLLPCPLYVNPPRRRQPSLFHLFLCPFSAIDGVNSINPPPYPRPAIQLIAREAASCSSPCPSHSLSPWPPGTASALRVCVLASARRLSQDSRRGVESATPSSRPRLRQLPLFPFEPPARVKVSAPASLLFSSGYPFFLLVVDI